MLTAILRKKKTEMWDILELELELELWDKKSEFYEKLQDKKSQIPFFIPWQKQACIEMSFVHNCCLWAE